MNTRTSTTCLIYVLTIFVYLLQPTHQEYVSVNSSNDGELVVEDWAETVEKPEDVTEEWTEWSSWSVCSRTCDGGVSYQMRKCQRASGCRGDAMKYRICNIQPCPDFKDFRASQCAAHNSAAYRGRLYEWLPYYDPEDPCSLTCQARSYSFVAKLASRVRDGTRCREGSLDMCVEGKCMPVGCDLQLGSTKTVDECGVCGGNGSTCRRPVYVWSESQFSPCSVTCGGGYQMSRPICLNKEGGKEVYERLCDESIRPRPVIRECSIEKCPAVWVTDNWGPCSVSCDGGFQTRHVYCAEGSSNGTRIPVSGGHCQKQKPLTEKPCSLHPCPTWVEGQWSGCSVTCGRGYQTRSVVCRDARGHPSEVCPTAYMPITKKICTTGIVCIKGESPSNGNSGIVFADGNKGSQEDAPPPSPFQSLPWSEKLLGPSPVSLEPSYIAGEWGPCSVSCGEGIRRRQVECKILLEFSRTVAKLPDKECPGPRPKEVEHCFPRPCALDQNKGEENSIPKGQVGIEVTYSWRVAGLTPCSASCLGGIRESIIQCVRDHDQAIISLLQCDIRKKPDSITQTCNDQPCPPRWNVSDFSPCTKHCGGGLQTREVQCLHEVTRGASNILIVPNNLCPQPAPRTKQYCNVLDCPSRWRVEQWSKCSVSCGGGVKTRKIKCQKELAFGQIVEQSPSSCTKKRPKTVKSCNKKACPVQRKEQPHNEIYVQQNPQRRVFLKVGGRATVFKGTNVKIRCPNKKSNKTTVIWYKDHKKIYPTKKLKISKKGALRIRRISYEDVGTYACASGSVKGELNIMVKPLPPGYDRIEDDRTVERPLEPSDYVPEPRSSGEEDYSHEHHHISRVDNKPSHSIPNPPRQRPEFDLNNFDILKNGKETPIKEEEASESKTDQIRQNKLKFISSKNINIPRSTSPKPTLETTTLTPTTTSQTLAKEDLFPTRHFVIPTKVFDSWEQQHGGALFSDQESGESIAGTPQGGREPVPDEDVQQPASSGAASSHGLPHIQQLLVNLHNSLGGARGRMSTPHDMEENDEDSDVLNPASLVSNSFVLGKGKAENLEFDWMITEWSSCSQPCGTDGFQVRVSQCLVRLNNVSKTVDSRLCVDAGLQSPVTIRKCGIEECPHWETGHWSECLESNCFSWHTAYQKRTVYCRLQNGTGVDTSKCDDKTRPRKKRECYNDHCKGTWTVGEWSECTAACGGQGFQTRILQCVWFGTIKPAGNACRDQPRPSVMRPCRGPPCQQSDRKQMH